MDMGKQIKHLNCPHCKVPSLFDSGMHWEGVRMFRCLQCWITWNEDHVEEYWGLVKTPPSEELARRTGPMPIPTEECNWDSPWEDIKI